MVQNKNYCRHSFICNREDRSWNDEWRITFLVWNDELENVVSGIDSPHFSNITATWPWYIISIHWDHILCTSSSANPFCRKKKLTILNKQGCMNVGKLTNQISNLNKSKLATRQLDSTRSALRTEHANILHKNSIIMRPLRSKNNWGFYNQFIESA